MTMTARDPDAVRVDRSLRLDHAAWMAAAAREQVLLLELLRGLTAADWERPTDNDQWDVRATVAHLAGAAAGNARLREGLRQLRLGRKAKAPGEDDVDGINAVQVRERADQGPADLVAELTAVGPAAVRARRRIPAPVRGLRVPFGPPLGTRSVGYLMDRIYTRDAWMHRIDLARATGRPLVLTPQHDGRLVADVVEEWARAHGRPFVLELTGPAGGRWTAGAGGPLLRADAVDFCRSVSGRDRLPGLLGTAVPF